MRRSRSPGEAPAGRERIRVASPVKPPGTVARPGTREARAGARSRARASSPGDLLPQRLVLALEPLGLRGRASRQARQPRVRVAERLPRPTIGGDWNGLGLRGRSPARSRPATSSLREEREGDEDEGAEHERAHHEPSPEGGGGSRRGLAVCGSPDADAQNRRPCGSVPEHRGRVAGLPGVSDFSRTPRRVLAPRDVPPRARRPVNCSKSSRLRPDDGDAGERALGQVDGHLRSRAGVARRAPGGERRHPRGRSRCPLISRESSGGSCRASIDRVDDLRRGLVERTPDLVGRDHDRLWRPSACPAAQPRPVPPPAGGARSRSRA